MSLRDYQIDHARRILAAWEVHGVALDASDTGSGKSFVQAWVCREGRVRVLVICPKSVVLDWFTILALFGVEVIGVVNYEQIKEQRVYVTREAAAAGQTSPALWLTADFKWSLPPGSAIIFDECHHGKNNGTGVGDLLISLRQAVLSGVKVSMLSATAADSVTTFRAVGAVLGVTQKDRGSYDRWVKRQKDPIAEIKRLIYGGGTPRASRMVSEELAQQKVADVVCVLPPDVLEKVIARIEDLRALLDDAVCHLGEIQRARVDIEVLKAPAVAELALEAIARGCYPAVFMNFSESRQIVYETLVTRAYVAGHMIAQIYGGQSVAERESAKTMFQTNAARAIVVSLASGGSSISLHTSDPGHPRVMFIMPTWSGIDMKQVLGRCARDGAADKTEAYIVYADCVLEKQVGERMMHKVGDINKLNAQQ